MIVLLLLMNVLMAANDMLMCELKRLWLIVNIDGVYGTFLDCELILFA